MKFIELTFLATIPFASFRLKLPLSIRLCLLPFYLISSDFFDVEFIAILTKADENLNSVVEALKTNNLDTFQNLGPYFVHHLD